MPQENNPYPCNHSCMIIFIILLSLIHLISSSSNNNTVETHYGACPPLKSICNFPQNITYPFFDGSRPDYCGRTGFKVDCIDDQSGNLAININNETYKINSINYTSKSLTVTKQQFLQGPCPAATDPLTNTTFGTTPFDLTSNSQNLALFYNCSSKLDSNTPVYFKCGGYRDNDSYELMINSTYNYVAIDEKQENEIEGLLCDVKIYLPVLRDEASDLAKNSTGVIIDDVVSKGFELKWVIDDSHCEKCEKSQGRCGYNETLKQTVCFCREAVYYDYQTCPTNSTATALAASPLNSPVGKTGMSGSAVGVIVAGALAAGSMIVGLLFFLNRRYRRRQSLSPDLQVSRKYNPSTFSTTLDPNVSTYFGVNIFSYNELEEATMFFDPGKVLGQGGFGTVYQGSLQDGREVAIKRLYENNSKRAEQFLNEVEILANLRHKNLVDLYGCTSRHGRELLLVYEYVPNGTVADHLHGRKAELRLLPWSARLRIAIETASALVYLHASDIIHRDVKTQNILLDTDFSVKVADFGLSRLFPLDATHVSTAPQGTPGYVDPEYHQYYQLTERSDVYSFGVVLAELISSKPAVDVTRRRTEINLSSMLRTKMQSGTLDEFVDPLLGFESDDIKKKVTAVANLAVQCLESTREMRPSMQQVLERLYNIQDEDDTSVRPEVFEIPSDDALMLKGDSSPSSPQRGDNSSRRNHVSA